MSEQQLTMIPVGFLIYSGRNPRTEMRGLEELAENIKEYGILQPIIVRPKEEKFEVVVGERRARASILAGLKEVPAIIRATTDRQADELRLIENIHREDLTNAEKGDAVTSLWETYPDKYPTFKSLSDNLGVKYDTLKVWLRYSRKLSDFVREGVDSSTLGEDQARFLLKYDQPIQDKLAMVLLKHKLNSIQTRQFLKFYDEEPTANLDELAQKAKGIEVIKVPLEKLPEEVRKEVKRVSEERLERKPLTEEVKKKIVETRKETEIRKEQRKKVKEPASLLRWVEDKIAEPVVVEKVEESQPSREPATITAKEIPEEVERLTKEFAEQVKETVTKVPEKVERVSEIVSESIKRVEMFPEKSEKIEPKFIKLETLMERGVIPYTIWDFQYRDDYAGDKDFHGNCSPQIVEQCIWRLTEEGDLVVDPMAGSGTALDVCKKFNRKCIGYDIKPLENRPDIIQNDSQKIPLDNEFIDMIFIHPPYWNLTYFTKAEERLPDLSRAKSLEEYLDMLKQVFQECYRTLKHGKFMCVLLGDLIRDGKFVPLCTKATEIAEELGFINYGYAVKLAHGEVSRKKSGVIIAEPVYTDNLKISHDLIMFFKKG